MEFVTDMVREIRKIKFHHWILGSITSSKRGDFITLTFSGTKYFAHDLNGNYIGYYNNLNEVDSYTENLPILEYWEYKNRGITYEI